MRRIIIVGVALAAMFPAVAWGAQYPSSCTVDEWTCTDWSMCGPDRLQVRSCQKTLDCPSVETPPKPSERQACGPGCTEDVWTCGAWTSCSVDGTQQRSCAMTGDCPIVVTLPPTRMQHCRLDCGPDIWVCTGWSVCNGAGEHTRTCARRTICEDPEIFPPKPLERERCGRGVTLPSPTPRVKSSSRPLTTPGKTPTPVPRSPVLACGNRTTLVDRVQCRLGLSLEGLADELAMQNLPEECRAMTDGEDRGRCVERYESLQPCLEKPLGEERFACAREVLGVPDFAARSNTYTPPCASDDAEFTRRCVERYRRERAYPYITFRFHDLIARAQDFRSDDAPLDPVTQFVSTAEQATIDFNAARSQEERAAIIRRVREGWRTLIGELPDGVRQRIRARSSTP